MVTFENKKGKNNISVFFDSPRNFVIIEHKRDLIKNDKKKFGKFWIFEGLGYINRPILSTFFIKQFFTYFYGILVQFYNTLASSTKMLKSSKKGKKFLKTIITKPKKVQKIRFFY